MPEVYSKCYLVQVDAVGSHAITRFSKQCSGPSDQHFTFGMLIISSCMVLQLLMGDNIWVCCCHALRVSVLTQFCRSDVRGYTLDAESFTSSSSVQQFSG